MLTIASIIAVIAVIAVMIVGAVYAAKRACRNADIEERELFPPQHFEIERDPEKIARILEGDDDWARHS